MIKVSNVNKKIKNHVVLKDVSAEFEDGKIYGLFGKNGSGKTMLLRTIAGLILPTEGEVSINGQILHKDISFPPNTGIIIEHLSMYPQYSAFDNLRMLSKIKKVATEEDILNALKRVELDEVAHNKVRSFSLGMKQRLNVAQAIFEKPDIILLDEPTNAIDQEGVQVVKDILIEERNRGAIIIIASHHQDEIIDLCDCVLRMNGGKLSYEEK